MPTPEPQPASLEDKAPESPVKTVSNGAPEKTVETSAEPESTTNGTSDVPNTSEEKPESDKDAAASMTETTTDVAAQASTPDKDEKTAADTPAPKKAEDSDVDMPDAEAAEKSSEKQETTVSRPKENGALEKSPAVEAAAEEKPKMPEAPKSPEAPPKSPTNDAHMSDGVSSAKVARERDTQEDDERSAKRAKHDTPEESIPPAPVPAPTAAVSSNGTGINGLSTLERWNDKDLEKQPITPYQAREYRRVLAGIKKTKGGGHFKDAVVKLWPTLGEAYLARVTKPMDIGLLERTLRDDPWPTLGGFKENLSLIYTNTLAFNGELHEVTLAGLGVVEAVWTRCLAVAANEPSRNKVPPKHMPPRHHEQRHSISHAPPPSTSQPASAPKHVSKPSTPGARRATSPNDHKAGGSDTYAVPPNGVPQIRRASTLTEGDRPKRAIHPPKSKDIDYTSKSGKKKLRPDLEFCEEVLSEIRNPRHYSINAAFLDPVDPVALDIPNYFQIIKKPMDLSTIASKLQAGEYPSPKHFLGDIDLMFRNCYLFNSAGTPVNIQGKALEKLFRAEWGKKEEWLAKHAASKAASISASSVRSDDEFDDTPAPAPPAVDPSLEHEIHALEEKMKEETQRLVDLYMEKHPIESMIELQKNMLNMVQASLLKAKSKQSAEIKTERPSKPKPKPARPSKNAAPNPTKKSSSNAGRKPLSGGSKKKRHITEHEKGLIATAINELNGAAIENAIDIIKRDTNQTENPNGELELDIDLLSNEALLKLWDLCKKYLPNFAAQNSTAEVPSTPRESNASQSAAAAAAAAAANAAASGGARAPKPKKNKPMSAREQEARIAHLTQVREQFRTTAPGASPEPMSDGAVDSDESDSEEE